MPKRRIFRRRHHRRSYRRKDGTPVSDSNVKETSYYRDFKNRCKREALRQKSSARRLSSSDASIATSQIEPSQTDACWEDYVSKEEKIAKLETAFNSVLFNDGYKAFKLIEAASAACDAGILKINDKGIEIRSQDPQKVILQQITATGEEVHIDTDLQACVNFDDLAQFMNVKKAEKPRTQLSLKFKDNNKVFIEKDKENPPTEVKKKLYALDMEMEDISLGNLPELYNKGAGKVEISKKQLEQIFAESGLTSQILDFSINKKGFSIAETGQIGSSKIKWTPGQLEKHEVNDDDGEVKASYNLGFFNTLKKIMPVMSESDPIILEMKDDSPLHIEIPLKEIDGKYNLYIAPKVEEEDNTPDNESEVI